MSWTMLGSEMNILENKKPCFSASLTTKASDGGISWPLIFTDRLV